MRGQFFRSYYRQHAKELIPDKKIIFYNMVVRIYIINQEQSKCTRIGLLRATKFIPYNSSALSEGYFLPYLRLQIPASADKCWMMDLERMFCSDICYLFMLCYLSSFFAFMQRLNFYIETIGFERKISQNIQIFLTKTFQ